MRNIQNNPEIRNALIEAANVMTAILTNGCQHPRQHVIGMFPKTTGGKEECLLCRKVRYQLVKDGPWRPWRDQAGK